MRATYIAIAILSFPLFFWGMELQRREVNLNMRQVDQHAYMFNAREIAKTHFEYKGDRNRMPVYVSLMSLFYRADVPLEEFFETGKRVGEVIAIVVVLIVFSVLIIYAALPDALTATLVAAFSVYAFKGPIFQAEVLFHGVLLIFFALAVSLVWRPKLKIAAVAGVVGGIAYLTKASVPLAIALCMAFLSLRGVLDLFDRFRKRPGSKTDTASASEGETPPASATWTQAAKPFFCILLFCACFLATVFPYIRDTKARFGSYFYNVNTTFYVWYDSWDEAKKTGTYAHGDMKGWPKMPADEIPSMRKYLREHTFRQMTDRMWRGAKKMWRHTLHSYGYVQFLAVYAMCVLAILLQNAREFLRWLSDRRNAILALFCLAFFAAHGAACAWVMGAFGGSRYAIILFLPALFVLVRLLAHARKSDWPLLRVARWRIPVSAVSPAVLVLLLYYVVFIFPYRVSTIFGGR